MYKSLAAVLLFALAGLGWLAWRTDRDRNVAMDRVSRLEAELAKRGVVIPSEEPQAEPEKAPAGSPKTVAAPREHVDVSKYLKMIDDLRGRAQELEKEVEAAKIEAEQGREKHALQVEELKKMASQLASVREDAQKQQRVSEALDVELKFKAQRLIQSETSEKLLQEKLQKAELLSKRVTVTTKDFDDLNRRREASILTLERRYREVTDMYRNFSLNLQTRETPGQGLQAGDLSRIQAALQQAEEELRQLRNLNARVAELAKVK